MRARRDELHAICLALPEASCRDGQHLRLTVRGRTFGYYLNDHHGDGIVAFSAKVGPGENDLLARLLPTRFYIPPYLGPRGWVALRLDLPEIDWDEVAELVLTSYRLVAPKSLAKRAATQTTTGAGARHHAAPA
jgi:predicted DNA-binding protein (MmcQ/YjbR family)